MCGELISEQYLVCLSDCHAAISHAAAESAVYVL